MARRENTHPIDAFLGTRIRMLRASRGLSMRDVALRVPISLQQLQKYETGSDRITVGRLYDIAAALGVSFEEVLGPLLASPEDRQLPSSVEHLTSEILSGLQPTLRRRLINLIRALSADTPDERLS